MISAVPSKPDWFFVDDETIKPINGLPGTLIKFKGRSIIHRSHLPLIDTDEAENIRAISTYFGESGWAARDAKMAELGVKLRTTQHSGIDYIEPRRGALIGDDMRLGKTITALGSHDPARGQLIVVAPLSARGVWLGWIKRLFPGVEVGVCTGKKYDPVKFKKSIVFCHYDIIGQWQSMSKIGTLVFDEAHSLTNRKTGRTIAACLLAANAEKVICLTGTPIWNMPPDLWSVVGLVAPGAWGSYHDFGNRYGRPEQTGYGTRYTGSSNESELNARMREVMLRRLWKDCAVDLPPISRSVIVAEVSEAERKKLDILAGALKEERSNTAANLASYRRHVTKLKLGVVHREAMKILDRGEPVVLWTWHRDAAEKLLELLGGERAFLIDGDVNADKREERIQAWRDSSKPMALIATMAVGQVAIDLSHARIAIFAEIDFTPAIIGQAEMRTFAATHAMDILYVVANHLVDQRIIRSLIAKLGAADSLGVGAACDAIDALRDAVMGPREDGDLDRLLEDFLASAA